MSQTTFTDPSLDTFIGLDELGLAATGQYLDPRAAIIACRPIPNEDDGWCRACGGQGRPRDSLIRRLAHTPQGWRPTILRVRLRRFACIECGHMWTQDLTSAVVGRGKLTIGAIRWGLVALVEHHLSISAIAKALGVAWHTANAAILTAGKALLIDDPGRFDGVEVLGVDEHVWRHTAKGDKYVTVIIDLTPVRNQTGPSRLLDMVPGRSKEVFKTWLNAQPKQWRDRIDVVAMDGFTGFKTAATEELPEATTVLDPFHVVRLGSQALDETRRRIQRRIHHRRGRKGDPLYSARRTLLTGMDLLNDKQIDRLETLFADSRHLEVETTWWIYQDMVAAYRHKKRSRGKKKLTRLITSIATGVPPGLVEVARLGRSLAKRAEDILAYFDRPGTSNGPTEAINGRIEHLRGIALGFRNFTHYRLRALLETGGFRPQLHPAL